MYNVGEVACNMIASEHATAVDKISVNSDAVDCGETKVENTSIFHISKPLSVKNYKGTSLAG